jgi:UDP-N-acetylmuramoyl-tripeptide--D-alanyl-D-alanine ligase
MDDPMTDLAAAATAISGTLRGDNVRFLRVTSDSRDVGAGDLFVALKGERFDGHDFVAGAFERGAAAALVAAERAPGLRGNLLVAADPLTALGDLASWWRRRFSLPLVAVVGSNGKTTVKEMIASIFRGAAGEEGMLATRGNLNNHIGLPLTLLRLREHHRLGVVELGMNHPGETAALARIAEPTIGLVNNAQREHQEFMSSVEDVAAEHAGLIASLPSTGDAIINADDAFAPYWREQAGSRQIWDFGLGADARIRGTAEPTPAGSRVTVHCDGNRAAFELQASGVHNVRNALAAAAAALAAGVDLPAIAAGLSAFRPVKGRLVRMRMSNGATLIDDSYNANPDSVRAAIDVLASSSGPTCLVLGDMGEVGAQGPAFHAEVGRYARERRIRRLLTLGEMSREAAQAFGSAASHCADIGEILEILRAELRADSTVLVKGSRFMAMERVVAGLQAATGGGD